MQAWLCVRTTGVSNKTSFFEGIVYLIDLSEESSRLVCYYMGHDLSFPRFSSKSIKGIKSY